MFLRLKVFITRKISDSLVNEIRALDKKFRGLIVSKKEVITK